MVLKVKDIKARQIFDSRGNPTIEVDVFTDNGYFRAKVPSGASTGLYEALELRDNNIKKFNGLGVEKAIANISLILKEIKGMDVEQQREIDKKLIELDGTENKSKLGANAMLAVSLAIARAGAKSKGKKLYEHIADIARNNEFKLPIPSFNVINGGVHAGNELDFQEFMIMPISAKNFKEAMRIGVEIYHHLKQIIKSKYGKNAINVGDEGGFAPPIKKPEEALELIIRAARAAGYLKKIKIAIDVAASEFYKNGYYIINEKHLKAEELMHYYLGLVEKYPIISIEDPFEQEDFESFAKLKELSKNLQIVGDDLLVTNSKRIISALTNNSCNALLLKVNQIGTLTEALDAAKLAMDNSWNVMVSHRSGETTDDFIADLAVGIGASQIKSGAPCRAERLSKYNQLLRIEEELGKKAKYSEFKIK
jgi:enolase